VFQSRGMTPIAKCARLAGIVILASGAALAQNTGEVAVWLTNPDKSALFERQKDALHFAPAGTDPAIVVDAGRRYQPIDGFGFALTGGSAQHLIRMDAATRSAILRETFSSEGKGIGVSYLRLSIGASDLNDRVFSYDDLAPGETDPRMERFSLNPDRADVIPVMKEILKIAPGIRILGSPWSAPAWMKSNQAVKGGHLKPEYYDAYAQYFVRYIDGMKAEGINIDAITVQNEPLNENNTPSMRMPAADQAGFIKNHLGPAFRRAGITTKIILYDHNCDVPEYATSILDDAGARQYVDGSGFHLYGGKIEAMSKVHNAYPGKNLYFTEQMVIGSVDGKPSVNVADPVARLIVGAIRNWSRNVLLWNLAADPNNQPHTDNGGCPMCQGAITIDGNTVTRNVAWYALAHASKFVRPGSVRIESSGPASLPNVAFDVPGGIRVLIVVNRNPAGQQFQIRDGDRAAAASLQAGAVATFCWKR
jgi:glucosylceramidase